jgi:hypothetical protein
VGGLLGRRLRLLVLLAGNLLSWHQLWALPLVSPVGADTHRQRAAGPHLMMQARGGVVSMTHSWVCIFGHGAPSEMQQGDT